MKISSHAAINHTQNQTLNSGSQSSLQQQTPLKDEPRIGSTIQLKSSQPTEAETLKSSHFAVGDEPGGNQIAEGSRSVQGRHNIILLDDSEKSQLILKLLDRLDKPAQTTLIDTDILQSDSFLQLAQQLRDEELQQFVAVTQALQSAPQRNKMPSVNISIIQLKAFVETLSTLDAQTRTQVLQQGGEHTAKVTVAETDQSYNQQGQLPNSSSSSANDVHNFVDAINNSSDAQGMLQGLQNFSVSQQSNLLQLLVADRLGSRVMQQLQDKSDAIKDSALQYLAGLSKNIEGFAPEYTLAVSGDDGGALLNYDNHSGRTAFAMIEHSVELLENYNFSDDQLEEMFAALHGLQVSDQRAYLQITSSGLEQLVGVKTALGDKLEITGNEAVMQTLENVRGNSQARDLVFKSRMGPSQLDQNGRKFYDIKDLSAAEKDQKNTINLLISETFYAINDSHLAAESSYDKNTNRLATNLLELGADARDPLTAQLSALARSEVPLQHLAGKTLQQNLSEFKQRTDSLVATSDIQTLLATQQQLAGQLDTDSSEHFWQAMAASGDKVDRAVELINHSPEEFKQQLIGYLADNYSPDSDNQKGRHMQQNIDELFAFFEADTDAKSSADFFQRKGY
ncbi:MAG: hypothetical protein MJK10_14575 [Pseudomonadales bacterium]|nr:hypothetical protein [Pseudomonadales bacterium]NRA17107.1 hypothetical protein [Oceanospirillaceae bacterium]